MKNITLKTLVATLLLLIVPTVGMAKVPSQGNGNSEKNKNKDADKSQRADVDYSDDVVEIVPGIRISFREVRHLAEAHHLTGVKPLPPGIQKNLTRGKPIPPGIAKTRLPDSFLSGLPTKKGYEWQRVGSDLLLVIDANRVIAGILSDIFK